MAVTEKSFVKVHYTGTLADGSVFDSSKEREPLEVVLGNGMLIPGFEAGLVGMEPGETKNVDIAAGNAYGARKEEMVQDIPKDKLPADQELKAGMQLVAQGPQGALPVTIVEVKEDGSAVLDFNHPLAGQDLKFELEVIENREATEEDLAKMMGPAGHEHDHDGGCCGGSDEKKEGECCDKGDDCCKNDDSKDASETPKKEE